MFATKPSIAQITYVYIQIKDLVITTLNPFTAEFSDALYTASEKPFYQITYTIYLLETIHKIVPYRLGKPKTNLD